MVIINNSEITKEYSNQTRCNSDEFVNQAAAIISPIIDITPIKKSNVAANNATTATGTSAIFTTPVSHDFYLQTVSFSYTKDAANDTASGQLTVSCVINGKTILIATHAILTLTAQSNTIFCHFDNLKLDRNSNVSIAGNTFTVGNLSRSASITGYIDYSR
jgi:hypothetical protein